MSSQLLRQLGIVSATALVVSNMIGTGIFTTTGFLAGQLGSVPLVLAIWVVGAVLCPHPNITYIILVLHAINLLFASMSTVNQL